MSREEPQVNFRMPADLKLRLESAAAANKRSLTAEFVARLEGSFSKNEDAETLREALVAVRRLAAVSAAVPTALAKQFRDVLDQIPKEISSKIAGVDEARALASAMLHGDPEEMFAALAPVLLARDEVAPAKALMQADLKTADALGLKPRPPLQQVGELRQSLSDRLTDAQIIKREPKQPVLSQGPRARKR